MGQASAFAGTIKQFIAGAALEEGDCVQITGVSAEPNPVPGVKVTTTVPKVGKVNADNPYLFLGVVRNAAAANEFVDVVVEGTVRAKVVSGQTLTVGKNLTIVIAGALTASSGGDYVAKSGEAKTTSGIELVEVWVSPVPIIQYAPA